MNIAASIYHIKRRVDSYLWEDTSDTVSGLRKIILNRFIPIGKVFIVGGLVRDLARGGIRNFKSDIDLIIDAPIDIIDGLGQALGGKKNRFGGFSIYQRNFKIDFWAFENTWAHRRGHIRAFNERDLLNSTFFDIDAVLYDVGEREIHSREDYIDLLYSKTLDINLRANPSIEGNALRAVRRLLGWGLRPKSQLSLFLTENINDHVMNYIILNEKRLYNNSYAESYDSAEELLEALIYPSCRKIIYYNQARQLNLPF